jgi:hypothetical protein
VLEGEASKPIGIVATTMYQPSRASKDPRALGS